MSDHRHLIGFWRPGLQVARCLIVTIATLWTATALGGCLVTEDIVFEGQTDVPPSLVFRPRSMPPLGDTLIVDSAELELRGQTHLTFTLQVRDENVLQDLETQIRLRTLASPTFNEQRVIDSEPGPMIPGAGNAVRDVEFSFLAAILREGHCHQLELAVSGKFLDLSDEAPIFAFPANPGDVAIATWWLWETNRDTPVNLQTCPSHAF